jgi:hypothetical protein
MSETQSGRWVGLALGALLMVTFVLNAISRTAEAGDDTTAAIATQQQR